MTTRKIKTDQDLITFSHKWMRAWINGGRPSMTAHESTFHFPALTRIPVQYCGIKDTKALTASAHRICVECMGRAPNRLRKRYYIRVSLDETSITHIVAPLLNLPIKPCGLAIVESPGGMRRATMETLKLLEEMHIEAAIRLRYRDALSNMQGEKIPVARARIEEGTLRDSIGDGSKQRTSPTALRV